MTMWISWVRGPHAYMDPMATCTPPSATWTSCLRGPHLAIRCAQQHRYRCGLAVDRHACKRGALRGLCRCAKHEESVSAACHLHKSSHDIDVVNAYEAEPPPLRPSLNLYAYSCLIEHAGRKNEEHGFCCAACQHEATCNMPSPTFATMIKYALGTCIVPFGELSVT